MAKGKDRDTSLRGPLCAGEAFELEAAGPRGLFSGKGCCAKEGARVDFGMCVGG